MRVADALLGVPRALGATCRPFNRGLRLDYFLASAAMAPAGGAGGSSDAGAPASAAPPRVHDAFICDGDTKDASDHAPVGVVLAL
jgi:exonuclease III